jgi:hypothetical protein
MGMTVIKDVPLALYADQPTMCITHSGNRLRVPEITDIGVGYDDSSKLIPVQRTIAYGVTQFMAEDRGVDKVIFAADFSGRRSLEKLVPNKSGALTVDEPGYELPDFSANGQHILTKLHCHGMLATVLFRVLIERSDSREKIYAAVIIDQDARVKLPEVAFAISDNSSVFMPDISVKLILPAWCIADRNSAFRAGTHAIVQIVSSVTALHHVGCPERVFFLVMRILIFAKNDTLIFPAAQITQWGRPADVIIYAKPMTVKPVVASENVQPIPENARLSVRNIFIGRKIRIECLHSSLPQQNFYFNH